MSFWSESNFIPGICLLFLLLLLCSCAPVTPFHSKHGFTPIDWLLFWLSSAFDSPACRAWSACACSSPFSLLLKQMLCSVLRLVSLFKHHWASDLGLHRSTKEHLCIFFSPGWARMHEIFLQREGARVGELYSRCCPSLPALCEQVGLEHIYFNFQQHLFTYLIYALQSQ